MRRKIVFVAGLLILAVAWAGPLPGLARQAFWAHMTMHMLVVAVAAPLLALAVRRTPQWLAPIPLSFVELAVVWAWHAPVLHHAARHHNLVLAAEQGTFLLAGLLVWIAAFANRAGAGIVALLLTSMHMTLLGALLALASRPLYQHGGIEDQHLGGAIMLVAGGAAYLLGGLWLTARLLVTTERRRPRRLAWRRPAPPPGRERGRSAEERT